MHSLCTNKAVRSILGREAKRHGAWKIEMGAAICANPRALLMNTYCGVANIADAQFCKMCAARIGVPIIMTPAVPAASGAVA